jgi:DNA-binding response OmpR family regulator
MSKPNKRILVCDDEIKIRKIIGEILSEEGFSVVTVGDGKEAYEEILKNNIDVVILDFIVTN